VSSEGLTFLTLNCNKLNSKLYNSKWHFLDDLCKIESAFSAVNQIQNRKRLCLVTIAVLLHGVEFMNWTGYTYLSRRSSRQRSKCTSPTVSITCSPVSCTLTSTAGSAWFRSFNPFTRACNKTFPYIFIAFMLCWSPTFPSHYILNWEIGNSQVRMQYEHKMQKIEALQRKKRGVLSSSYAEFDYILHTFT